MTDKNLDYNKSKCSANARLEFRGAVPVALKSRFKNEDYTALDLVFSEKIHMRFFDPERSVMERIRQYTIFTELCKCVGTDFLDIPPCPGGWEDFVIEFTSLLVGHKYILLYAKLTINEDGRIVPGTGKCFSLEPDMEYSDEDLRFLDSEETYRPTNQIKIEDLPATPRDTSGFDEAVQLPTLSRVGKKSPLLIVRENKKEKIEADSDTWELGMKDPMKPPKENPFEEVVVVSSETAVFEEYNLEHEKPAWVVGEVEKQKPKAKPRGKKRAPVTLELNKEGLEDIGLKDLPGYDGLPF